LIVWGNHSASQYPDTFHATVDGRDLRTVVNDKENLNGPFIKKVALRGAEIIKDMKINTATKDLVRMKIDLKATPAQQQ
jgi:malate dehydrogenase